jgi:ketosteroid isomerase-like protein
MPARENLELIRAWVDAINRNDVEEELACWQPDGEMTVVPTGTTFKGTEALRRGGEHSAAMVGAQPIEGRKQITNLFASDEWACVEYDVRASVAGPIEMQGVQIIPAGIERAIDLKVCVIAHVRDGKMDVAREYWDSASMARQLGLDNARVAAVYSSLGTDAG